MIRANKANRKYDLPKSKFGFSPSSAALKGKSGSSTGAIISERGDSPESSDEISALRLSFKFSIRGAKGPPWAAIMLWGFYAEPGVLRVSRATRVIHYTVSSGRHSRAVMAPLRYHRCARLNALPLCGGDTRVSSYLAYQLETEIPEDVDFSGAEAIVVLGADVRRGDGRNSDRIGPASLERLVLAVDAYRRLHLPIAVSGGRVADWHVAVGQLMKSALEEYFGIPVTWSEEESRTTYENALYTARLLRREQIHTVVVIAQTEDLPRAIWCFKRVGLRAIPWPAPRSSLSLDQAQYFLPQSGALEESFMRCMT